jgi:hypothetical protein
MSNPTGQKTAVYGTFTDVDTTPKFNLGDVQKDELNNEYIYLKGVDSTVVHTAVVYDEVYQTTLLGAATPGPVAVAMASVTSSKYGWYQKGGAATVLVAANFADNGHIYGTATPGTVDDAVVDGALVHGATGRSAIVTATGTATVQLNEPYQVGNLNVLT